MGTNPCEEQQRFYLYNKITIWTKKTKMGKLSYSISLAFFSKRGRNTGLSQLFPR